MVNNKIKVCHITSAHLPEDVRIFDKECISLANNGYDLYLVEQGNSYEKSKVKIIGYGEQSSNRIGRMLFSAKKAYICAKNIDADIYHIHDPELLPYGRKLKKAGKKVIFDSHEDYPSQIKGKYWIPRSIRNIVSYVYEKYERQVLSELDGVIGVSPHSIARLLKINPNTEMICNFPKACLYDELPKFRTRRVVFPGLVFDSWSIQQILKAIEDIDDVIFSIRSAYAVDEKYMDVLSSYPSWTKVDFQGRVPHEEAIELIQDSYCGLALAQYGPNVNGKEGTLGNTKLFEYMQCGIPVVCTDLKLWKQIVEENHCGICVNPDDIKGIHDAIKYLLNNPEDARQMGLNGRKAVSEQYSWVHEEKKLLRLYHLVEGGNNNVKGM
ncbi:MAG: glycosyltransferase [Agathobacter sp.]